MRTKLIMAMLFVSSSRVAALQQAPDLTLLRRGTDSMSIALVRNGTETPAGQLWDNLSDISFGGGPALRRIYRTVNTIFGPQAETTVVVVRIPELSLLSRRTYSQSASDSLVESGDSIRGWRQAGQRGRLQVSRLADRAAIDGSLFDALIRAAPLAPGYRIEARAYVGSQDTTAVLTATVSGTAPIRRRDMRVVDTWVVEMDFLGLSTTLWIDTGTRDLVREVIHLSPEFQVLMQR